MWIMGVDISFIPRLSRPVKKEEEKNVHSCYSTFGVLDSENQPGSRAYRGWLTPRYENKKSFKIIYINKSIEF